MDTYKCNYHLYSRYSEGELSPGQLVRKYAEEEYDIIALTDLGTVEGVREFMAACEAAGIKGVPGVEFSTVHTFDGGDHTICILGYHIDPSNEELLRTCKELESKGGTLSSEAAISLISAAGGQAFVGCPGMIKGLPERETREFWLKADALLRDLRTKGLKGLECITPAHSEEEEYRFIQLAGKHHLHISSGTDFNG